MGKSIDHNRNAFKRKALERFEPKKKEKWQSDASAKAASVGRSLSPEEIEKAMRERG